jgi:transposase InsO family protein
MLANKLGVTMACQLVGLSRSSYYHEPVASTEDEALIKALRQEAGRHPTYGYRRLTAEVCRKHKDLKPLNTKRVRRVMKTAGIQVKRRRRARHTTNSVHGFKRFPNLVQDLQIVRPDQVWVCDIAAILLANGQEVYLAIVMDVFTRMIRGWELSRDLTHALTVGALNRALLHGSPEVHHSDQGVQYATPKYTQRLEVLGVQISMAEVGEAWQNGYAERWIRTLREEEETLTEYQDFADAYRQIGRFIKDVYNRRRIHSSLGYMTPAEFEAQWRMQLDS